MKEVIILSIYVKSFLVITGCGLVISGIENKNGAKGK